MTYEFYKENFGKMTKVMRNNQPIWRRRLQLELQAEEARLVGIASWRARADALNEGDIVGLLYDKLQEAKEIILKQEKELTFKEEVIQEYKRKEPYEGYKNV